jgi:CRISPR/Cas system-associated protein endoribonuclease Cas2
MGIFLLLLSVEIYLRLIEGRVEVEAMEEVLMRVLEDRGMINRFDIEE